MRERVGWFELTDTRRRVISGHDHTLKNSLLWDIHFDESVQVAQRHIHGSAVWSHDVRPRHSSNRYMRRVVHLCQINDVDFLPAHGTDENKSVTAGIVRIVRLSNWQCLHDLLPPDINDVCGIVVADRDYGIPSVEGHRALVRVARQLDGGHDLVGCSVDFTQRIVGFRCGEQSAAIPLNRQTMYLLANLDIVYRLHRLQVNDGNVVPRAVVHIYPGVLCGGFGHGAEDGTA